MATLLCSLLIGNNYGAFVVSGYATREVVNNDLKRVDCPYIPQCSAQVRSITSIIIIIIGAFNIIHTSIGSPLTIGARIEKYQFREIRQQITLRSEIDLQSKFVQELEAKRLAKLEAEKQLELLRKTEERIILEQLGDDPERGKRLHAWVVILSNVDWAAKKSVDASTNSDEIRPFFIEPTTGAHFSVDDTNYFAIESIWNDHNYYVRCQIRE